MALHGHSTRHCAANDTSITLDKAAVQNARQQRKQCHDIWRKEFGLLNTILHCISLFIVNHHLIRNGIE
jgi:hypothetical protein